MTRSGPTSKRRTPRKKQPPAEGLFKLAVVVVVAAIFLGHPQALVAVSDGAAKLFTDQVVTQPDEAQPPAVKTHHKHPRRESDSQTHKAR